MERTRGEIILFAITIAGIWVSIWGVLLSNHWLDALSVILLVIGLTGFSLRNNA
jgi:hypothetical protein